MPSGRGPWDGGPLIAKGGSMTRQIHVGFRAPSTALLEERILQLETKVALLTHAVQALRQQLEERTET
jgi:hypothetical protein